MNKRPRVCLFTSFHPDQGGGGSACLQSVIPHFTKVDIRWLYLGTNEAAFPNTRKIGRPLVGGTLLRDLVCAPLYWAGWQSEKLHSIVAELQKEEADAYWIVAMNEGILVGNVVARRSGKPIHVSVQDDQAEAICRRSRRYRWLKPLALRLWDKLMKTASSVDTISDGMRRYYMKHRGIDSFVFHPYVPKLLPFSSPSDENELGIGHMGTIYSEDELCAFMQGAGAAASKLGRRLRLTFIGGNRFDPTKFSLLVPPESKIENLNEVPEAEALELLKNCQLLYAMYPFDDRNRVFRQTSFPTKLSSYIKLQRPIFAHTLEDSTLASFVSENSIGVVCNSLSQDRICDSIVSVIKDPVPPSNFEFARQKAYGSDRVTSLEDALYRLATASNSPA